MYRYRKLSPQEQREVVEGRKSRGFPHHQPPHPIRDRRYYLITASCFEHKPILNTAERRQYLRETLFTELSAIGVTFKAWSILLNHYHLLVETPDFNAMAKCIGKVHGKTSFKWNRDENQRGRKVWYRYVDRAIRSERHYWAVVNYIHFNPVKHRLVDSPYDWGESSLKWYEVDLGRDWLRENWKRYPVQDMGNGWDDF